VTGDVGSSSGAGSSLIANIRTFAGHFKIMNNDLSVKGMQVPGFMAFVIEILERGLPGKSMMAN
jgi:hypothetical protein